MGSTSKMSEAKMREALAAVAAAQERCLAQLNDFEASVPRRMNVAQRERLAFIRGRLAGLHQASREFGMRAPLEIYGS